MSLTQNNFHPGLADHLFSRGEAPMTKCEIRAVLASKLRVAPGHLCWDIGAGTGSVSVEMALAAGPAGQVYAIEGETAARELITANAAKFGCRVEVVAGLAPEACQGLSTPDRIFIGGSGGNLPAVLATAIRALRPGGIIAADFIVLNNVEIALRAMEQSQLTDVGVVMLGANPVTLLPGGRMMLRQATPILMVWGSKPGGASHEV